MTDRTFGILWRGAGLGLGAWVWGAVGNHVFPMTGAEYIAAMPNAVGFMFIGIMIFYLGADHGEDWQIDKQRKWEEAQEYERIMEAEEAQEYERIIAAAISGEEAGKGPEPEVAADAGVPAPVAVRSWGDGWATADYWAKADAAPSAPEPAEEPVAGRRRKAWDHPPKRYYGRPLSKGEPKPLRYPPPPRRSSRKKPESYTPPRYPPPASR